MSVKILIAGGTASGKSTLARHIADYTGFPVASFGGCLRNYAREHTLPLSVESLQHLGQGLISQLGYDGFLQWVIDHSREVYWKQALVLDGVRHEAMYVALKKVFPQHVLVYCVCSHETQIRRMINRDGVARGDAERILAHPLERFVADLEPEARLLFRPEDSIDNLLAQLDMLIGQQ